MRHGTVTRVSGVVFGLCLTDFLVLFIGRKLSERTHTHTERLLEMG